MTIFLTAVVATLAIAPIAPSIDVRALATEAASVMTGAVYGFLCAIGEGL